MQTTNNNGRTGANDGGRQLPAKGLSPGGSGGGMLLSPFSNLLRRGQHNVAKILCLGVGLAISAVLIGEVYFERTFDTWFQGADRTYRINEAFIQNGEYHEYPQTSGAIAPGLKKLSPQIEAATRYTGFIYDGWFRVNGKELKVPEMEAADSCFFDVFPQRQLAGNLKQALSRAFYVAVSESMAKRIGGNVVGMKLKGRDSYAVDFTIGGVYQDFPYGSSLHGTDVLCAMNTLRTAFKDDDWSTFWIGTDRFHSYIRLRKGTTAASLQPNVKKMMAQVADYKLADKAGVKMNYTFTQMNKAYTSSDQIKTMTIILSVLAVVLLLSSVMNYLLIIVGNLPVRSREMAVRKCYGADAGTIRRIVFGEAFAHVLLSIVLAGLLLFASKGLVGQLTSAPLSALLFSRVGWILALVCLLILLVGGLLPAWLYNRVPVAAAFRGLRENRHRWKLALLSVEFASVSFLLCLLLTVHRQYDLMVNDDPGYAYANLLKVGVNGAKPEELDKMMQELRRMPEVDKVSSCSTIPLWGASGNNVGLPGDDKELFNTADLYGVTDGYFDLMEIPIVQGTVFTARRDSVQEVMVSQKFVEKMKTTAHWDGNVIGRKVWITGHSEYGKGQVTIVGVYKDIRIGTLANADDRPSIIVYSKQPCMNQLVKLHELTPENKDKVQAAMQRLFPDREVIVQAWPEMMHRVYTNVGNFRKAMVIAGIATLVIALMGLVGYTTDEVNRRRKEIALRKVNGAHTRDILRLFMANISWVAVPSLIVGAVGAYFVGARMLQLFSERVSLGPLPFVLCLACLLAIVLAVVVANCYRVANSNPVEYLKEE
jgi:putative ABC transport system permease protein